MYDPAILRQLDHDADQMADAVERLRGKGYLRELLALTPTLWAIHEARGAGRGWRAVADHPVILGKIRQLQEAVDAGILNPEAHMFALRRLGMFTTFDAALKEAYVIMLEYILDR